MKVVTSWIEPGGVEREVMCVGSTRMRVVSLVLDVLNCMSLQVIQTSNQLRQSVILEAGCDGVMNSTHAQQPVCIHHHSVHCYKLQQ